MGKKNGKSSSGSSGHTGGTRPGQTLKKPKDLSTREREEHGCGELKTKPINGCRCDERLKTKVEESTHLTFPRLVGELEHLKIETRLIDEMFPSEMSVYVFLM